MNYSEKFSDVMNIVNSLNNKDLLNICNGDFKNSPFVKYRKVLLIDSNPVSFIKFYLFPVQLFINY